MALWTTKLSLAVVLCNTWELLDPEQYPVDSAARAEKAMELVTQVVSALPNHKLLLVLTGSSLFQTHLQAWCASLPPADQTTFDSPQFANVSALSDQLVSLLSPHYSDDAITQLFLPEPYPTPLPAAPFPPARPNTEPLFLPDTEVEDPLALTTSAHPAISPQSTRPWKKKDLVCLLSSLPPDGSLATELAADTAHRASAKDWEAQQLDDLIRTNTDPTGHGRHVSTKEKKAASANGEFPPILSLLLPTHFLTSAIDTFKLPRTADGLAIWPPPSAAAATSPQERNPVSSPQSIPSFLQC